MTFYVNVAGNTSDNNPITLSITGCNKTASGYVYTGGYLQSTRLTNAQFVLGLYSVVWASNKWIRIHHP